MKKIIATLATVLTGVISFAQQEYSFTNYFEINSFYNPAATGTEALQQITGIFRKQWAGLEGSPIGGGLVYENKLPKFNMGLGGYVFSDQIGAMSMTNIAVNYSYSLKLNETYQLAFGLDAGVDIYDTDYDRLVYWDNDVMFDDQKSTIAVPRAGVGAHLYTDKYYVGLSVPRLLSFNNSSALSITSDNLPKVVSNYYLTAGYKFPAGENFELQANILGKFTPRVIPQGDFNLMATYHNMIGLGMGYKSMGFLSAYLQYTYANVVTIGYAYDLSVTRMAKYSSGSHEVMLKYAIPKKNKGQSSVGK